MSGPHRPVDVPGRSAPSGYSDATAAAAGRVVHLGGHVAFDAERRLRHPGELVPQLAATLENLRATLQAAGGAPEHLVRLTIYTTDVPAYRAATREIGAHWRRVLGRVFPAMTLIGVQALFEPEAVIEIDAVAVIP
jgi:enamine deaminase RidA (YjgF/YER057c/UK114 family)